MKPFRNKQRKDQQRKDKKFMTYWLCEKIGLCEKYGPHNKDYFLAGKILELLNMCKNHGFLEVI